MNRGLTVGALCACAAAGILVAMLLAAPQGAGADDGTTTSPVTTTAPVTTTTSTETSVTTTTPLAPQPKVIAPGVRIGGTLVGGLTVVEAREVVRSHFERPLRLTGGPGARIVVTPQELGAVGHTEEALKLAARVKRPGFVVPLRVEVSTARVDRLIASLARRFQRDPIDATLKLRNLKPFATREVPGRRLKQVVAGRAIVLALRTQARGPLELPLEAIEPAVTGDTVGRAIVIRRGSNRLFFYQVGKRPRLIRSFQVATGRSQYPTPLGRFAVVVKQFNPWWYPPAGSDWARDAKPIPPGPGNPLGTRWMGLSAPNVGIHGTPDAASIGYSASHGCIRMLIPQVEWLFGQVDLGTPVFIVAA